MPFTLDDPTVLRAGPDPILGPPVLSLAYRPGTGDPDSEAPLVVLTRWVVQHENRFRALDADLAWRRRGPLVHLGYWVRARSVLAWHAARRRWLAWRTSKE